MKKIHNYSSSLACLKTYTEEVQLVGKAAGSMIKCKDIIKIPIFLSLIPFSEFKLSDSYLLTMGIIGFITI